MSAKPPPRAKRVEHDIAILPMRLGLVTDNNSGQLVFELRVGSSCAEASRALVGANHDWTLTEGC